MEGAKKIIRCLEARGYEGYIVGGAVRDYIMGKEPSDIDITTNAEPGEVENIFKETYPTGKEYGTITVMEGGVGYEVTTYRLDSEETDGRRPKGVKYAKTLEEDLCRRDITINAMAMGIDGGIVDLYGGQEDIKKGIIRAVGDADTRVKEDSLRMLRVIRFAARYNYEVEGETKRAIKENKERIQKVSKERIQEEMGKILISENVVKGIELMRETGLLGEILPEVEAMYGVEQNNPHHKYTVYEHTLKALESVEAREDYRWVMLLHDTGKVETREVEDGVDRFKGHEKKSKEVAEGVMTRLKYSNKFKERVVEMVYRHDQDIEPRERPIRRAKSKMVYMDMEDWLKVRRADLRGQSEYKREEKESRLNKIEELMKKEPKMTERDLKIDGYKIMEYGYKGVEIGQVKKELFEYILEDPRRNTEEELEERVKEIRGGVKCD